VKVETWGPWGCKAHGGSRAKPNGQGSGGARSSLIKAVLEDT